MARGGWATQLLEATLAVDDDGSLIIALHEDETGAQVEWIKLRPGFLDEYVARARAQEAAA